MDTPKPPQKPAQLLDDLESIRQLLGDDNPVSYTHLTLPTKA